MSQPPSISSPMKLGLVRKKPGRLNLPEKVQQSFIVDPYGKFKHGQLVIDELGLKKTNQENDELSNLSLNIEELELLDILGRGASSYVQKAKNKLTNTYLALKVIDVFDKDKRHQLIKEIKTLHEANSPYLVSFYGAFYRDGQISIGIELMDAGSLEDILRRQGKFPEAALMHIAKDVLEGFKYLHEVRKSIHRDVKPSNICLNMKGTAKLTDFGVASDMGCDANTFCGTFVYMSPERVNGKPYNFNSDLWSFGLCLMECAIGKFPYPQSLGYLDMVQSIVSDSAPRLPDESNFSDAFVSFLDSCLHKKPDQRPSASELLKHPWFEDEELKKFKVDEWLAKGKDKK